MNHLVLNVNPSERLRWQCRRGLLELDLLLESFLTAGYALLDENERADFEALLRLPDPELLTYLVGTASPPCQGWSRVVELIRRSAQPFD